MGKTFKDGFAKNAYVGKKHKYIPKFTRNREEGITTEEARNANRSMKKAARREAKEDINNQLNDKYDEDGDNEGSAETESSS